MCRKPMPAILFTLVLVGLSNSAFKIQSIEVVVSSGYDASLVRAALFLNSTQFDSAVGLCRVAPNVDHDAFWLVSDNLLAYHALEYYYPETAAIVYATMLHYGYFRSYKHEVLFGTTISYIPFRTNNTYLVAQNGTKLIETEVFNSSSPVGNYTGYADLCIYAALHFYWCGNIPLAVVHFDMAKEFWIEALHGIYDNASIEAENNGSTLIFSTYKLALLLYCSRILGQPLENETSIEETLWLMQDGENGGLHTDYDINLNYTGSDANTETTSLAILAYKYEPKIINRPAQFPPSLNIPPDYSTIQEAVNSANEGDTIFVGQGTYYENVVVNKTIWLIGESTENTTIDGKGTDNVLESTVDGVLVSNFTISNGEAGIYLQNAAQNNIEENDFILNGVGVFMDGGYNNNIQRNNFTSNSYGVYMTFNESLVYIGSSFNNQIVRNSFLNNTQGIHSDIGAAMFINSQLNTTILENKIQNSINGISLSLSPGNQISENTIWQNENGLAIDLSSGNSIANNNITNCGVGLTLSLSSGNLIYENVIADNNIGMSLSLSSGNTIYNNDFAGNAQQAGASLGSSSWNISYPQGGNFWSDYAGMDEYSGPYQNEMGSDGIGDTPYSISSDNVDYYPLMMSVILKSYNLTVISEAGGTTNPIPGTYPYLAGTNITFSAIPDNGYSFDHWVLDGFVRGENPIEVTITSNHTLTAYFFDNIAPEIGDLSQNPPPDSVQSFQNVTVFVSVTDYGTGIRNVTLWYSLNNGTSWTILNMSEILATYEAIIPGYENGTWVSYKILAYDNAGNNVTKDNNGYYYEYHVIPEFPTILILPLLMLATMLAIIVYRRKHSVNAISVWS